MVRYSLYHQGPIPRRLFLCLDGKCLLLSECLSVAGLMTVRGVDNLFFSFSRYIGMNEHIIDIECRRISPYGTSS